MTSWGEGCMRKHWCLRLSCFHVLWEGPLAGGVLIFGLVPRRHVFHGLHMQKVNTSEGIGFLLNSTKQLGAESDTPWESICSGNKQVRHIRSISVQRKCGICSLTHSTFALKKSRCRRRADLCEAQSQLHALPLTVWLCCACLWAGYIKSDSLYPSSWAWWLACPPMSLHKRILRFPLHKKGIYPLE